MKIPKLILTIGLPGSGKTTWAKSKSIDTVEPDHIRQLVGEHTFTEKFIWYRTKKLVFNKLLTKKDVILDATNVSASGRKNFIKNLPQHKLYYKLFKIKPEDSKKRRPEIPPKKIDKMYNQLKKGEKQLHEWKKYK